MNLIIKTLRLSVSIMLLLLFYGATLNAEQIVYDNTTPVSFGALFNGQKFGNQITLGGTDRTITDFTFAVSQYTTSFMDGDEALKVSFYENDGDWVWLPGGIQIQSPGTLIWSSPDISGLNTITNFPQPISVNVPNVLVSDTFTWVIEVDFGDNYHYVVNEQGTEEEAVQFVISNPPSVGSIDPSWFWWWQEGDMMNPAYWGTIGFGSYNSYYAKITAASIPEPTTVLLLGIGLVGLAGVRRKLKK